MKIATLQFAPVVGDFAANVDAAEAVLAAAQPEDLQGLDLLVLPELALTGVASPSTDGVLQGFARTFELFVSGAVALVFLSCRGLKCQAIDIPVSGYNFKSLNHIHGFLEIAQLGPSSKWACEKAKQYGCFVTIGYPESVDVSSKWPADAEYYNSTITLNPEGEVVANYRKTHLYYTDETWALEGTGFLGRRIGDLGTCAMGICMDINPYKFLASEWHEYEFAHHVLDCRAELVILSMAWLTREDATSYHINAGAPDKDTLTYWIQRLGPLVVADRDYEIVVVIANRCGVEEEAVYAGTSTVLSIFRKKVKLFGILSRGRSGLLVVDTSQKPKARIVIPPDLLAFAAERKLEEDNSEGHFNSLRQFDITSAVSTKVGPKRPEQAEVSQGRETATLTNRFSSSTVFDDDASFCHEHEIDVDEQPLY